MELNVLIPCHNEELTIEKTISRIRNHLPDCRILVIDNASTDQTPLLAKKLHVDTVYESTLGKGFAVRRGFLNIDLDCKYIFIIDGDDTYDCNNFSAGLEMLKKNSLDMVVGHRNPKKNAREHRHQNYRKGHSLGNKTLSLLYRVLFGVQLKDSLSGWRIMSRPFVDSFNGGASKFEIEAELNVHAYSLRSAIGEIPVDYYGRPLNSFSKLKTFKDGWAIMKKNLTLFRRERPSVAYFLFSLPSFIVATILIIKVLTTYIQTTLVPQFPSLITSMAFYTIASNLWVTGMILEKVQVNRAITLQFAYKDSAKSLRKLE